MSSPNACSPRVASMRSPRAEGDDLESPSASPSGREYTSLASLMQQDREPSLPTLPQARNKRDRHVGWRIDLPEPASQVGQKKDKARLSFWQLIALTMSMGGSQIAWTVELGYGTPYLLELGLSEQLTSLVWLAGPISGLVVQPLIGAISDSSASHYRRRFWVVASTVLLVLSGLGLAFTDPVARAIVALIGGGQGDWDPKNAEMVKSTSILIAVFCFYCLDFALNGLQASLRNLTFDVTPAEQLNSANAWNGRFGHIGNIVGFAMGMLKLNGMPFLKWIGGDQFRKLCVLALLLLVATVWITCWTIEEDERPTQFGQDGRSKLRDVVGTIHEAINTLPKPVRRICMVQIAAFMGWFPFLFYSTTYVAEVMSYEQGQDADRDEATRVGSFALLIYSFVAIFAGTVLPYLSERDQRLIRVADADGAEGAEHDEESARVRETVRQWRDEARQHGRSLKLPHSEIRPLTSLTPVPFMLRNVWTSAMVLFFVLMMSTFAITKVWQATVMISLVGICWAVACWAPFAMLMEFLRELEASNAAEPPRPPPSRAWSTGPDETTPLRPPVTRSYSTADMETAGIEFVAKGPVAGGTIMGIHNLAIVIPQFIIAIIASIIFKLADGDKATGVHSGHQPDSEPYRAQTGVAWVLRFGGLMALVGAIICRRVPPTKTEKAMRRRLAEIREAESENRD